MLGKLFKKKDKSNEEALEENISHASQNSEVLKPEAPQETLQNSEDKAADKPDESQASPENKSEKKPDSDSEIPPSERLEKESHPIKDKVIAVLKDCYDPEIPVNIFELGLIYEIEVKENNHVDLLMTLTSPMCPVAESLPPEVEEKINAIPEVASAKVELTWEPTWSPEKMSEAAKLQLNL